MKKIILLLAISSILSCTGEERHFLKDSEYRHKTLEQFEKRKTETAGRSKELFSVFERENMSLEQREALQFLYAYMPLCDVADYNGDFFLKHVEASFQARDFFPWGKTVPDDIFRHFVLPYRVNNEDLDTARIVFFNELKDRVKNLSMAEAALEVNHWCHEKVTYRGTDARTSSPLALVRTSWGRCGEESTFTTAALRAVGIPARQCYTPRWVHTDDNHAWVEVWIDGKWNFIGACEPEPELNMAWFTSPAKRTMMVHTNVFGMYSGSEEKNEETVLYAKINTLQNYAETRTVRVLVTDENSQPVENATVKFTVYNYAEFYPIATGVTDKNGYASLISGKGDLFIWANKNGIYGYAKSEVNDTLATVALNRKPDLPYEETFVMNVPPEKPAEKIDPQKIQTNMARLVAEDSIRNTYMQTFISQEQAYKFAEQENLNRDEVWKYLQLSQGNWQEISSFMQSEKENPELFLFLKTLTEKDLRDVPADYLTDHIKYGKTVKIKNGVPAEMIVPYILSPRIETEKIKPWRSFLQQHCSGEFIDSAQANINYIIDYVKSNITIDDSANYCNCRISPRGVYELGIADRHSRNIFFVAICRTAGIASRIEQATSLPQYFENGQWHSVLFDEQQTTVANLRKSRLNVASAPENIITPAYYSHYTLARFNNGDFHTLDFENNSDVKRFPYSLLLDEGYYRLTVGSRANDGSVTVNVTDFYMDGKNSHAVTVKMPETKGKLFVKGIVDMNTLVSLQNKKSVTLKELSNNRGLMLCFIDPGKEPSKHILQDLPAVQAELEQLNGGILLMIPSGKFSGSFDISTFKNLPKQTVWTVDESDTLLKTLCNTLQTDITDNFPFTIYLSRNGGILYSNTGYKIGTGDDILKIMKSE